LKHRHKDNCKKCDLTYLTSIKTNQELFFVTIKIKFTFDGQIFFLNLLFCSFIFVIQLFFNPYIFVKEGTYSMQ